GVGQAGGRVRVIDDDVVTFALVRVAGQAAAAAQQVEAVLPAGDDLVDVRLVAGVEQDPVLGRVEDAVQGEGQLDDAQVGAEVAAGAGDLPDQEVADLRGQHGQLVRRQPAEVLRTTNCLKQTTFSDRAVGGTHERPVY